MRRSVLPVLTVVLAILAIWYVAAIPMNIRETLTEAERAGAEVWGGTAPERQDRSAWALALRNPDLALNGWSQERGA